MRTVADLMTRDPVVVAPTASFKDVVRIMTQRRVSALPVVDREGRVLGIVSEHDVLQKERFPCSELGPIFEGKRARADRRKAAARTAAELMSAPAVTVEPHEPVRDAACRMGERRVKRLPVVDGDGRLCGIVSRRDLLTLFLREDDEIADAVRSAVTTDGLDMDSTGIVVGVEEGVVTLEGWVGRRSTADRVSLVARQIEGVTAVRCLLRWKLDDVTPDAYRPAWPAAG